MVISLTIDFHGLIVFFSASNFIIEIRNNFIIEIRRHGNHLCIHLGMDPVPHPQQPCISLLLNRETFH